MQIRCVIILGNAVGYANNDAGKPAQQCLSASFKTIGLTWTDEEGNKCEGVRLADLKFIGYDVNEDGIGDIWTDNLVINMLHTDGSNLYDESGIMKTYHWVDNEEFSAGWYDENYDPIDGTSPLGDAATIYFKVGVGIQFTNGIEDDRVRLVCNGEVVQVPVDYAAATPAQQCAGNPLARKVYLSEITVSGYDVNEEGIGDIWTDNVVINMLHTDGSNLYDESGIMKTYHWVDNEEFSAGWYDENYDPIDGTSPLGDATVLGFEMGEGIQITNGIEDPRIVFHFPSLWAPQPTKD